IMNLNDTKSSETLRKEISQDIDRLDNKVEHLKGRLTPGQIIDDAIFSPYRGDLRAGFSYLRNNPIGSSFLAIGTLLLMDNEGESYEQYLRSQGRVAYSDYKGRVSEVKNRVSETMDEVSHEVRSRTQSLVEKGEQKLNQVRDTGRDLKNQVGSMTDNIREKLNRSKTSGEEIKNNVIDATESFKERAVNAAKSTDLGIDADIDIDTSEVTSRLSRMKGSVSGFGKNTIGKIKENEFDSLAYVALGGSLGFATGSLIPMREGGFAELSSDFDFSSLQSELQDAANESMSVFKNEFIDTLKNASIDIF
ncbi:MAG TPA: hypothetical protein VKZ84_03195, partial [Bacteriovoracaceae bacterium]|nr:hypothetical protein [Bacteriovoracaceae bacterium]